MSESLEELKRQRSVIDKKIRSMTTTAKNIIDTENFTVKRIRRDCISVKCRMSGFQRCSQIGICYSSNDVIKFVSSMICQLEHIREQLNNKSAV